MNRPLLLSLLAVGLVSCADDLGFKAGFELPVHVAVLDDASPGPFEHAIGFAADSHGGVIRILNLGRGGFVATGGAASFSRSAHMALGAERILGELAAWAPDDRTVSVLALDRRHNVLVRAPYITNRDGDRLEQVAPSATVQAFDDRDGSGDETRARDIVVVPGRAAHEVWTFTARSGVFDVSGTRSGMQRDPALPGGLWRSDDGGVQVLLTGSATDGDTLTLEVDAGVEELAFAGTPLHLALHPDMSIAAVVYQPDASTPVVVWVDPATLEVLGTVPLPEGASPGPMVWAADRQQLYIADTSSPAVYDVTRGTRDPMGVAVHDLPWPVEHIAYVNDASGDDAPEPLLFLHPVGQNSVWRYHLDRRQVLDTNTLTAGADGMPFSSPVLGLTAITTASDRPELDAEGSPLMGRAVAVSLQGGQVRLLEAESGCQLEDVSFGPRSVVNLSGIGTGNSAGDLQTNFDLAPPTSPWMESTRTADVHITVNSCAGIAPTEDWTVTYDSLIGGWRVEGTRSGLQAAVAYEDERYLSDAAEISFTLRSGSNPSEDGQQFGFSVIEGAAYADGDTDGNGTRDIPFEHPGPPQVFHVTSGGTRRPLVLVAASGTDYILKIDPRTAIVSDLWD